MNERTKHILYGAAPALLIGFGSGLSIGLFIVKKKIENKYLELSNKEIAEAKVFYSALYKKDEFETPESAAESLGLTPEVDDSSDSLLTDAIDAMQDYQGTAVIVKKNKHKDKGKKTRIIEEIPLSSISIGIEETLDDPIEPVVHNIFVDSLPIEQSDFDYEEEIKNRNPALPYVITKDEYFSNEPEFDQTTFTYFASDDVVVDEKDVVVTNHDTVLGDDNLLQFGHGSGDPHIVYIRNENLNLDFEVVGNNGNYSEQILGYIKHEDRSHRKTRRSRGDDD